MEKPRGLERPVTWDLVRTTAGRDRIGRLKNIPVKTDRIIKVILLDTIAAENIWPLDQRRLALSRGNVLGSLFFLCLPPDFSLCKSIVAQMPGRLRRARSLANP